MKTKVTGSGHKLSEDEWIVYRSNVYECLFYHNKKWTFEGQSMFFQWFTCTLLRLHES